MSLPDSVPDNAFQCELQLRWSDQDLLAHVNNARIVTLGEEARIRSDAAWFADAAQAGGRVVRSQRIDFDAPIHYGPALYAAVWVCRIGRTSFTLVHELWQKQQRCARIEAVMVGLDPETGRPTPIPDETRAVLEQHQPPTAH